MDINKEVSAVCKRMRIKDAIHGKLNCTSCGAKIRYSQSKNMAFCPKCLKELKL
jgi:predicted RNA-binding Zn-ribbon protein involved in translation (DUF1610 family)